MLLISSLADISVGELISQLDLLIPFGNGLQARQR